MLNIWLVAQHEFITNIRKRSFLFAVFGVPLVMVALMAGSFAISLSAEEQGLDAQRIGFVDNADIITMADEAIYTAFADAEAARTALDADEIDAYFVIPSLYISTGRVTIFAPQEINDDTEDRIELLLAENLVSGIESDVPAERLYDPVNMTYYLESTGRELTMAGFFGLLIAPVLFAVVMMIALQLSSTYLMSGVVEEKTNHIMELLITSVTPYELLTGKLFGLGALGLVQVLVWLVAAAIGLMLFGSADALTSISLPLDFVLVVLLYFVLTYFLYGSVLAGIGAVVGSEQESRTYAGFITIFIGVPFFFFSLLILNPESPVFLVLQLFPFTGAMTYIMRFAFTTVPLWQVMTSLVLLAISSLAVTWASAKVFRWALLLYGKKPNIGTLWRVIRGQPDMGIIPATKEEASA